MVWRRSAVLVVRLVALLARINKLNSYGSILEMYFKTDVFHTCKEYFSTGRTNVMKACLRKVILCEK